MSYHSRHSESATEQAGISPTGLEARDPPFRQGSSGDSVAKGPSISRGPKCLSWKIAVTRTKIPEKARFVQEADASRAASAIMSSGASPVNHCFREGEGKAVDAPFCRSALVDTTVAWKTHATPVPTLLSLAVLSRSSRRSLEHLCLDRQRFASDSLGVLWFPRPNGSLVWRGRPAVAGRVSTSDGVVTAGRASWRLGHGLRGRRVHAGMSIWAKSSCGLPESSNPWSCDAGSSRTMVDWSWHTSTRSPLSSRQTSLLGSNVALSSVWTVSHARCCTLSEPSLLPGHHWRVTSILVLSSRGSRRTCSPPNHLQHRHPLASGPHLPARIVTVYGEQTLQPIGCTAVGCERCGIRGGCMEPWDGSCFCR